MTVTAIIEEARAKVGDDWEQVAWVLAEALVIVAEKVSPGFVRMPPVECRPKKEVPTAIE